MNSALARQPGEPDWVEAIYWVERFGYRDGRIRLARRVQAASEAEALAAIKAAADVDVGAAAVRMERCPLTRRLIRVRILKSLGDLPEGYVPALLHLVHDATVAKKAAVRT